MNSQDIKNLSSSSSTARTEIPDRLRENKDLRYIRIKKKEKKPFEDFWTHGNLEEAKADWDKRKAAWEKNGKKGRLPKKPSRVTNYPATDPILDQHLARGGNYGIAAGYGGLAIFDSDAEDRLQELGVFEKLPPTFRVRTGSGGFHRYYYIPDLDGKIVLYDKTLKDPKKPEEALHLGEIQWIGTQVVGPGSTHPNGNKYEVVDDLPIATITMAQLLDAISCCKFSKNDRKPAPRAAKKKKSKSSKPRASSAIGDSIPIQDIAMPDNPRERNGKNGREIFGSHPIHGSTTGKNFHINVDKNTWYCHRCGSGGGPLEWIAVMCGIISCSQVGPKCLKGEKYIQVLEEARALGYEIHEKGQSTGQFEAIEKRIQCDNLPEDLPPDQVGVIKGAPRIGKTHWVVKQLIKAQSGCYITHNHSIANHALRIFKKNGGRDAVHLEGKSRPGMCQNQGTTCRECELCPNQHDDGHISYTELEMRARDLLLRHGILTKEKIPYDLCPYYTLKLAERFAKYCFTVPHFIQEIGSRQLIVLDEDPTLSYFFPKSPMLFRYKKERYENKFENVLGKALEQASEIRERIEKKGRASEEDKLLLWCIDSFGGINEVIKTTMSSNSAPEECCYKIEELLTHKYNTVYDNDLIEKSLEKLKEYHIDYSSDVDLKDYIGCWFHLYGKKPLFTLTSGRSGYRSVHLIGDATSPALNMGWSALAMKSEQKILVIGNTLAELFGKALGNAIVIEIPFFKYANNYVVIPVDSSKEKMYDGTVKNQRLKVKKLIKMVAGDPDNEYRHPVMVLTGSKKNQETLIKSIGGICHASQEEGEIGQKWNHQSGTVNVFYQNSTISRGLDVDQYNVLFVHDADFALPFWSAAIEAGEDSAEDILASIIMDETTNSVLRISPVVGCNQFHPKVVIIPRNDLWKIRHICDRVLDRKCGGRTPDIEDIATLIKESGIIDTVNLKEHGEVVYNDPMGPEWEKAVCENTLIDKFKLNLNRVSARGRYTREELEEAIERILKVLKKAGKGEWMSKKDMRKNGLKCKDSLIRPALDRLYYENKAVWKMIGRRNMWSYNQD